MGVDGGGVLRHFLSTSKWLISRFRGPFKIGVVNGGKHIKNGVPKKGTYNQNIGPLSNNFKLERLVGCGSGK